MIKLISLKTRHDDLTRAAFRQYYEGTHVPLGLRHIEQFRWRKYVRNHLRPDQATFAGIDCYTEFWIASAADQAVTRAFVASPEFVELDRDDRRFLNVERRCAFEVVEHLLAGTPRSVETSPALRRTLLLKRVSGVSPADFTAALWSTARQLVRQSAHALERITLDLPVVDDDAARPLDALLSFWPLLADSRLPSLNWQSPLARASVFDLDVIETPPTLLVPT